MNLLARCFVPLILSAVLATATYTMDDRNTSIQYLPTSEWTRGLDPQEYLGTETCTVDSQNVQQCNSFLTSSLSVATCNTADNCRMIIPFRGSGITIYVAFGPAIGFRVSVDEGSPSEYQFDGACLTLCGWRYNLSAYDVQSLQSGDHNVAFTLIDSTGLLATPTRNTTIYFDHAVVNEANITPTSASRTATSSASGAVVTFRSRHKTSLIGPAVGGVVAGIVLLVITIIVVIGLRRRRPRPPTQPIMSSNLQGPPGPHSYLAQNPHQPPYTPSYPPPSSVSSWPSSWNAPHPSPSPQAPSLAPSGWSLPQNPSPMTKFPPAQVMLNAPAYGSVDPYYSTPSPTFPSVSQVMSSAPQISKDSPQDPPRFTPSPSFASSPITPMSTSQVQDQPDTGQLSSSGKSSAPAFPIANINTQSQTDENSALIMRLCNLKVPPADVTRVVALLSGPSLPTIEDGQLLQRLYGLNIPPGDMSKIVDAMEKSPQAGGSTSAGNAPFTDAPPQYDFKGSI